MHACTIFKFVLFCFDWGLCSSATLQTGIVRHWIAGRGTGFITPAAGGEDFFVDKSMLVDRHALVPGSLVTFEPGWDIKQNVPVAMRVWSDGAPIDDEDREVYVLVTRHGVS